jgi:hypothetical protein
VDKLCECGCGNPTKPAQKTSARFGHVQGQPTRFICGHHTPPLTKAPPHNRGLRLPYKDLWARIMPEPNSGCWIWIGGRGRSGHGQTWDSVKRRQDGAHRVLYKMFKGEIPEGLELDHLCRLSSCVNPDHLEPVTHRQNLMRGFSPSALKARQTVCRLGHPLAVRKSGQRVCRICQSVRDARRRNKGGRTEAA